MSSAAAERSSSRAGRPRWLAVSLALPTVLYRRRFGWLLGRRFLCLRHTGRRSGRTYLTVLEVIADDRSRNEVTVMAGFGGGAQWLRNLRAGGPAEVSIGREQWTAAHRELTVPEAAATLAAYERRHPWLTPLVRRLLSRLSAVAYDGSAASREAVVTALPMVALQPRAPRALTDPRQPWP